MKQELIGYILGDVVELKKFRYIRNFHRTFSFITGMTANEYIRNRRLTLAAQELQTTDISVIDVVQPQLRSLSRKLVIRRQMIPTMRYILKTVKAVCSANYGLLLRKIEYWRFLWNKE